MHIALGGCLKAPPIRYGLTDDTGGHIAYILAAARAQAARHDIDRVEIVTRRFDAPGLDAAHARAEEPLGPKSRLLRIDDGCADYLSKEALEAQVPAFTAAFLDHLAALPRKPDAIHAHFADAAAVALAARDRFGIPVLYTPHSLALDKARAMRRPDDGMRRRIEAETRAIAEADAIVVSSRDEAERQVCAYAGADPARIHCIAPGPTLPEGAGPEAARALIAPELTAPEKPFILAVARPVEKKNLAGLVEIFATTPGLREHANLVILAGLRGPERLGSAEGRRVIAAIEAMVHEHGLEGRVALPPEHDAGRLGALYRLAAAQGGVFANPALTEPFGLTILEAAEAGLPVVATCHGGPSDIVARIGHGLTADPRDTAGFGAALSRLLGDSELWARCAEAAATGGSAYDWDAWARRVSGLLAEVAAPRPVPAPARILASDIDNTLTGDRAAIADFAAWRAQGHAMFAVATGRTLSEARRILSEWEVPEPDAFITSCGTEIYIRDETGRLRFDASFAREIGADWRHDEIARLLDNPSIRPQPALEQRRWKLGYLGCARQAQRIRNRLDMAGLAARVVASHGNLIDVMPVRAGKGAAVAHLARHYGLTLEHCVTAGDSGNDDCMLRAAGHAIVVGNADGDLALLPRRPGLHRSRGHHAAGLMEGLARAGLCPPVADNIDAPIAMAAE
ncbi:HAD-IIB family hydrolase [Limimaricola pyoseonensis]|nr:HAD-IIB family hydrolase [Limimaricola pyoseonensis]